jgi:putative membrane protein
VHHEPGLVQGGAAGWYEILAVGVLLVLAIGYAEAWWMSRGRWPLFRVALWYLGLACCAATVVGPVARAAHESFTGHMLTHLLLAMIGPLLLVQAKPITLVLRALPVRLARGLSGVLRNRLLGVLFHPITTAVLNGGGLWLLYSTGLFSLMHRSELVNGLVHAHLLLAGYLFTASLVGRDPNPHRASFGMRSAVLIVFMAAHSILAKQLYAFPPEGVDLADAHAAAQLMYYGGDVVDVGLIVLLFTGRRPGSPRPRRARPWPSPSRS